MTFTTKNLLIITSLLIASCGQEKKQPSKDSWKVRYEKQKQLDTLNLTKAEEFSKTANAIIGWDITNQFTYSLQELSESTQRPISFIGEIKDIIKKDSSYILKVVNTNSESSKNFVAEISVNTNMFQTIKSKLDPNESNEGCFIFQVIKISSHLPILKSEIESNGEDMEDASSYLTLDFDESLVKLQGKLITFFMYDRLKEDDE